MTFKENIAKQLDLATEPKKINLATVTAAAITTSSTVTTLTNYSSPKFTSFDTIKAAYMLQIVNASGNAEVFDVTLDIGTPTYTAQFTVNNSVTANILVEVTLTKFSDNYVVNVLFTDGTTNTIKSAVAADSVVSGLTLTATNTSVISAGLTLAGLGGYVILDTL